MKDTPRCPRCNKPWSIHLGHKDLCQTLQTALRAITVIRTMSGPEVQAICDTVLVLPTRDEAQVLKYAEKKKLKMKAKGKLTEEPVK